MSNKTKRRSSYTLNNYTRFFKVLNEVVKRHKLKGDCRDFVLPKANLIGLSITSGYQNLLDAYRYLLDNYDFIVNETKSTDYTPIYTLDEYKTARSDVLIGVVNDGIRFKYRSSFNAENVVTVNDIISTWEQDLVNFLNAEDEHVFTRTGIFSDEDIKHVHEIVDNITDIHVVINHAEIKIIK